MAKVVLIPCKLREDRFARQKGGESVELTPQELMTKFHMKAGSREVVETLRRMAPQGFLGLREGATGPSHFYFRNNDLSGDIGWLLKRSPDFAAQVLEVWMVDRVEWDGTGIVREGRSTGAKESWQEGTNP